MEYVSQLVGEPFSDRPKCTDALVADLARFVKTAPPTGPGTGWPCSLRSWARNPTARRPHPEPVDVRPGQRVAVTGTVGQYREVSSPSEKIPYVQDSMYADHATGPYLYDAAVR